MKSLLGLYLDPNDAANAMDGLAEGGFEQGTFDVLTGTHIQREPLVNMYLNIDYSDSLHLVQ